MTTFKVHHQLFVLLCIILPSFGMAENITTQKEFDCVIIPSKIADLGSNASGLISTIGVDRNDQVEKGDVLFVLDDSVEKATVALATKQASLTSELKMCKIKVAHSKRERNRAEQAYKKKALSLHDFDRKKVELQLEKMKLLQAKEKLAIANKELNRAKAKLAHRTVRAPFSGVITDKFKTMGEYVNGEAVLRLAQLDPLHIEVIVPVTHEEEIKAGMHARVCSNLENGNGFNAVVSQVDQVMDARSGTFGVRLTLPNPDHEITAGIRCDLTFLSPEPIPKKTVQKNNKEGVTLSHG